MKTHNVKYHYFVCLWKALISAFKLANESQLIIENQTIGNTLYVKDKIVLKYELEITFVSKDKIENKQPPTEFCIDVK